MEDPRPESQQGPEARPIHGEQPRAHQQPYPYPPYPPYPPYAPPAKTNSKSIVAMILGIMSIVVPYVGLIIGIVAIVFAALSFKELKRTGEQGRGMAVAGLVCGIIGTTIYSLILLFIIILFAYSGSTTWESNLTTLNA
ncbi:DUF4190 domain-containing protein [Cohnella sp. REN36]|uniref:DUF4190 domain-containing protein n=1 Tax=Cohnella sp. REN36 TaxID=2887347 RepID=UPI001D14FD7C|nr:DUF4190 domain-containing protein [Cohnella sp. REN36]MCC3375014.1 DUF4190 domain-containing protein [Cohnella sp. REN36]